MLRLTQCIGIYIGILVTSATTGHGGSVVSALASQAKGRGSILVAGAFSPQVFSIFPFCGSVATIEKWYFREWQIDTVGQNCVAATEHSWHLVAMSKWQAANGVWYSMWDQSFHLQKRILRNSWPITELNFQAPPSFQRCTYWRTILFLGSNDGT